MNENERRALAAAISATMDGRLEPIREVLRSALARLEALERVAKATRAAAAYPRTLPRSRAALARARVATQPRKST